MAEPPEKEPLLGAALTGSPDPTGSDSSENIQEDRSQLPTPPHPHPHHQALTGPPDPTRGVSSQIIQDDHSQLPKLPLPDHHQAPTGPLTSRGDSSGHIPDNHSQLLTPALLPDQASQGIADDGMEDHNAPDHEQLERPAEINAGIFTVIAGYVKSLFSLRDPMLISAQSLSSESLPVLSALEETDLLNIEKELEELINQLSNLLGNGELDVFGVITGIIVGLTTWLVSGMFAHFPCSMAMAVSILTTTGVVAASVGCVVLGYKKLRSLEIQSMRNEKKFNIWRLKVDLYEERIRAKIILESQIVNRTTSCGKHMVKGPIETRINMLMGVNVNTFKLGCYKWILHGVSLVIVAFALGFPLLTCFNQCTYCAKFLSKFVSYYQF